MAATSENQKALFERIHSSYVAHYYDPSGLQYRREFILQPLIADAATDLNGCRVAEVAAGSGYNSLFLRDHFPGVDCTGFDISPAACADYRRITGFSAYEIDLTKPLQPGAYGAPYDAVVVIGGLHHCVADLPQTMQNIATLVRPGGLLLMMEPSSRYMLEGLRRLWYQLDPSFDAKTEAALDHAKLAAISSAWFRVVSVRYGGGPAFFLIQNSMITRVPLWLKPALSRILLPLERWYARIRYHRCHAFFLAVWQRTETVVSEKTQVAPDPANDVEPTA